MATSASAFVSTPSLNALSRRSSTKPLYSFLDEIDEDLDKALGRRVEYKAGAADSEFAKRFGHLAGKEIKTVGEAFRDFTDMLGSPINALYKNMMTDIVGTLHLILVNGRFQRDGIFSLGLLTSLELLLRNYPEEDIKSDIVSSLLKSVGLDEEELKVEARVIEDWAKGKTKDEISAALQGEGDSPVSEIARAAKGDEFWMYSRYFGIGLIRMMECTGIEMESETCYPIMEEWIGTCLGKPYFTACNDNDTYFKVKGKLDMMETLMKEVEIREKKRLAQRLEDKAEAALRRADKEVRLQKEIASDTEKIEEAEVLTR
eukprot:CAMPEP_0172486548 /NCGR_PEP_ID=MMETSP1066-20121228/15171_1 /TAXON_ID=671091 /ORGANISM="Coscinodiscus wailesii, Strain CCMP2513" /LENGTH=316 /DNA_ID=CAMNT_0013252571 /DNA_START=421 /DNA_END=1371 /DNA_ORIENTATION=+